MKTIIKINKILVGLIIITVFFFLLGVTYSFFTAGLTGNETSQTISAEAGDMEIVYDSGPNIEALDIEPSYYPFAIKTFTVTGNSTIKNRKMGYKLSLKVNENTFSENAISYTIESFNTSENGTTVPSTTERQYINNSNIDLGYGNFIGRVTDSIHTYILKVYFYETMANQSGDMRKKFGAQIGIEEYDPCWDGNCLKDLILAEGGGASAIEAKGNPNFAHASGSSNSGLYASEDEYGTSYYYRGNRDLLNNNLIFGGYQWKIIRINGDGSIRILYNGTEAQFTSSGTMNTIGMNTQVNITEWNSTHNDAKYLGYMFGGENGVASTQRNGEVSAAATYNETSSNAKVKLDLWYETNIKDEPFESKIVDNLFCNDRQKRDDPGIGGAATGLGYGSSETEYAAYYRLKTNKTPTLKCGQKNDRFTKNDIILGNGALIYPVGLMSADEVAMSGVVWGNASSGNHYLSTYQNYWLFTPSLMLPPAYGTFMKKIGDEIMSGSLGSMYGLRPVINISSDVTVMGEGTETIPYRVE